MLLYQPMSFLEQNELRRTIKESSPDRFRTVFSQWISMPRYDPHNEDYSLLTSIADSKRTPEIERFLGEIRAKVSKKLEHHDYDGATSALSEAFQESNKLFTGDHITTVQRFIWYRAGFVHEHRATYGDLSKRPLGDRDRTACFLKAATCYMQTDIPLGYVSDYAGRVFESLGGAGPLYGEFAGRAIQKLFGQDVTVVGPDDPGGRAVIQDLKRRSKDIRKGIVPGGGDMTFVNRDDLPPANSN